MAFVTVDGLGSVKVTPDKQARINLYAAAMLTVNNWRGMLTDILNGKLSVRAIVLNGVTTTPIPGATVSTLFTAQQRSFLTKANTQIAEQVIPTLGTVVYDESLTLNEVVRRINSFLKEYGSDLDAQIAIAQGQAGRSSFGGALSVFKDAGVEVLKKTSEGVDITTRASMGLVPWYVWAGAGLFGTAYVWRAFK